MLGLEAVMVEVVFLRAPERVSWMGDLWVLLLLLLVESFFGFVLFFFFLKDDISLENRIAVIHKNSVGL